MDDDGVGADEAGEEAGAETASGAGEVCEAGGPAAGSGLGSVNGPFCPQPAVRAAAARPKPMHATTRARGRERNATLEFNLNMRNLSDPPWRSIRHR